MPKLGNCVCCGFRNTRIWYCSRCGNSCCYTCYFKGFCLSCFGRLKKKYKLSLRVSL